MEDSDYRHGLKTLLKDDIEAWQERKLRKKANKDY